ncbi:Nuclear factor related to kappa-B-binding protein [Camellia lanceoleosa]|uniref:Nuclear factor related to kappa-B-binding protein n=1 Tax=Camellia lanceoleosa TaxID=1840588 RepID=A0ACC0HR89_9ERIC|nr:Nuclear factor related to kappa-B-binding protein [Camellia lanceoleosa]
MLKTTATLCNGSLSVRDAIARLLEVWVQSGCVYSIRDSRFVVDEISILNLTKLWRSFRPHYELDPCVKYDRDRHLWVYLHGERKKKSLRVMVPLPKKV